MSTLHMIGTWVSHFTNPYLDITIRCKTVFFSWQINDMYIHHIYLRAWKVVYVSIKMASLIVLM